MRRNATTGSLLAIAALTLGATACGGDEAVESIIENAVENETGGEVDLDFDGDGSFSIETEDGSMTMDEDGNMVIIGEDGEVITGQIDADDGSMTLESEDGSFSFDADEDGSVTMDGEDGSFSIDTDDDGTMTFETDEGTMTVQTGEGIPDEWPGDVPRPEGLSLEPSQVSTAPELLLVTVSGEAPDGPDWFDDYSGALQSAGFSESFRIDSPDGVQAAYERGNEMISLLAASSDGGARWGVFLSLSISDE